MNQLKGTIKDIQSTDHMSLVSVEVNGDVFSAIVLEGKRGPAPYKMKDNVTLLFKETEVGLAKDLSGSVSFRNRFKGVITKIEKGPLLAKITLKFQKHTIESIISTQSSDQMNLKEADHVFKNIHSLGRYLSHNKLI